MKKAISIFSVLCLLLASLSLSAAALTPAAVGASEWDGTYPAANADYAWAGAGTEADPYLIRSAAELAQLSANVRLDSKDTTYGGKWFRLTCDIDLKNHPWLGIGGAKFDADSVSSDGKTGLTYFAGNFDGDYHRIYNLNIATRGKTSGGTEKILHQQGLFGYIVGARILNLGIESGTANMDTSNRVGALVGIARFGFLIENCYSKVDVTVTSNMKYTQVGGLIGLSVDAWNATVKNSDGTTTITNTEINTEGVYQEKLIRNCYNMGALTVNIKSTNAKNEYRIGGLIGYYVGGAPTLDGAWQMGDVTVVSDSVNSSSTNRCVGGVTGAILDSASVKNTYFMGNFSVTMNVATDASKQKWGILFGRCIDKVSYDTTNGINVGYRSNDGYKAMDQTKSTGWYAEMTDITLPLATGSAFLTAPAMPIAFAGFQATKVYTATVDGETVSLYDVRLLATVDSLEWYAAGFDVTVTVGEKTYRLPANAVTTAYCSILETQADGTTVTKSAPEGKWFIALTVTGIPAGETPNFCVANYVCSDADTVARSTAAVRFTAQAEN